MATKATRETGIVPAALTMKQAAAALNVSIGTAYRLANEKLLKTYTVGRSRYASPRAVEACVNALEKRGSALPMDSPAGRRGPRMHADVIDDVEHA